MTHSENREDQPPRRATPSKASPLGGHPSTGSGRTEYSKRGGPLYIGQAAARSGVSAKMIRHYELHGLLPTVARTDSGYRRYSDKEVHTLRFIQIGRAHV